MLTLMKNSRHQHQICRISRQLYNQGVVKPDVNTPMTSLNPNVPGLTEKCVAVPDHPVGPNASKTEEYKNPEYFCYHSNSFAEAEVELAKFRLPIPSNRK